MRLPRPLPLHFTFHSISVSLSLSLSLFSSSLFLQISSWGFSLGVAMAARSLLSVLLLLACVLLEPQNARALTLSARLIHRFSDEAKALRISRSGEDPKDLGRWPQRNSMDYYHLLASTDFQKQKMKLGSRRHFQFLFPSEGSNTVSFGNDFGWCVSFLPHFTSFQISCFQA